MPMGLRKVRTRRRHIHRLLVRARHFDNDAMRTLISAVEIARNVGSDGLFLRRLLRNALVIST
jgi:hypothetical protein